MSERAATFDPVVSRRAPAVPDIRFRCVCCQQEDVPVFEDRWRPQLHSKPPLCLRCENHWGSRVARPPRMTKGDLRALKRLVAITERLNWEIHNGDERWRK